MVLAISSTDETILFAFHTCVPQMQQRNREMPGLCKMLSKYDGTPLNHDSKSPKEIFPRKLRLFQMQLEHQ